MPPSVFMNGNTFQGYVNARIQNEIRTSSDSAVHAIYKDLPLVVGYIQNFPFTRDDRYLMSLHACKERTARQYFISYWQKALGIRNAEALRRIWEESLADNEACSKTGRPVIALENNRGITADGFIEAIYRVFALKLRPDF